MDGGARMDTIEKRRYRRLPINLKLGVSSLFKQDNEKIGGLDTQIEVFDISKSGIGFTTSSILPVGYYFNAAIEFETADNKLLTVVKILYCADNGDGTKRYGCEFVGLAPIFYYIFDEYEEKLKEANLLDEENN